MEQVGHAPHCAISYPSGRCPLVKTDSIENKTLIFNAIIGSRAEYQSGGQFGACLCPAPRSRLGVSLRIAGHVAAARRQPQCCWPRWISATHGLPCTPHQQRSAPPFYSYHEGKKKEIFTRDVIVLIKWPSSFGQVFYLNCVRLLCKHGAHTNCSSRSNLTPLHVLVFTASENIALNREEEKSQVIIFLFFILRSIIFYSLGVKKRTEA